MVQVSGDRESLPQHRVVRITPAGSAAFYAPSWSRMAELAWSLALKDVTIHYKQTVLGILWVVLQPIILALIYGMVFTYIFRTTPSDLPFLVFFLTGLSLWSFFARCVSRGAGVLMSFRSVIQKVYFPRIVLPISTTLAGFVDLVLSLLVLAGVMAWFGVVPSAQLWILPGLILYFAFLGLAIALWMSALNIRYRDTVVLLPLLLQAAMYLSPVLYPLSFVPEGARFFFMLNPVAPALEFGRWAILPNYPQPDVWPLGIGLGVIAILLVGGGLFFSRSERELVDSL